MAQFIPHGAISSSEIRFGFILELSNEMFMFKKMSEDDLIHDPPVPDLFGRQAHINLAVPIRTPALQGIAEPLRGRLDER